MTDATLDREQVQGKVYKVANLVIKMVLMSLCLYGAVTLLNWAIDSKLAQTDATLGSPLTTEVRERQLTCLARNIYHEAGFEPFEGQAAVAQVTMNRAASGKYPSDICQVIYQKNVIYGKIICQYSWYCDRASVAKVINQSAYNESMKVAKMVLLEGFRLPGLTEAMFYHADYVNPGWKKQRITKIGHHIFYK